MTAPSGNLSTRPAKTPRVKAVPPLRHVTIASRTAVGRSAAAALGGTADPEPATRGGTARLRPGRGGRLRAVASRPDRRFPGWAGRLDDRARIPRGVDQEGGEEAHRSAPGRPPHGLQSE